MAGKKGNKAHANKTSYPNQKNRAIHPAVIMRLLKKLLENTKNSDDILCWQDACMSVNCRSTKLDYWCKKIPIFESIKKEAFAIIVSRVNSKALHGKFNPASSIWRMKQLGEIDKQELDNNIKLPTSIKGITFDE